MTRETNYFVQAFNAGRGGNLKADPPIACNWGFGARGASGRLQKGTRPPSFTAPASVDEASAGRLLERCFQ
jgi:hypothetical protein